MAAQNAPSTKGCALTLSLFSVSGETPSRTISPVFMDLDPVNCPDFRWITHVKLNAWAVALISLCVAVISAIMSAALMLLLPYGDPEILVRDLKVYIILLPVPIFLIRDLLRIIAFLLFGDVRLNCIIFAYPFARSGIFSRPNHLLRINGYKSCLIFLAVITIVIACLSLLIYPSLWTVFLVGMTIGWSVGDVWLLYRLKERDV